MNIVLCTIVLRQARMLSGRFRTCWLSRHWSGKSDGFCSLPNCQDIQPLVLSSLLHILTDCVDHSPSRQRVFSMWHEFLRDKPHLFPIIKKYTVESTPDQLLQFILDCTVLPDAIALRQLLGSELHDTLLYLTRTLCFSKHKSRNKLLGKWNIR